MQNVVGNLFAASYFVCVKGNLTNKPREHVDTLKTNLDPQMLNFGWIQTPFCIGDNTCFAFSNAAHTTAVTEAAIIYCLYQKVPSESKAVSQGVYD